MTNEKLIEKALKLECGGIYVIECDHFLSSDQRAKLLHEFEGLYGRFGITFIFLDGGLKISKETVKAA